MSLSKKVVLTVSGYKISLSDSLQFYQNDQLKLIFEINKYGIDVASSFTHKNLMPLQPLTATLFIETPLGVDSIESANIEDNAVTFYLTSNQTQHIGTSTMQIKLTDDDGCQITLPSFTFEVQKNIYDNAVHVSGILLADENGNTVSDENGNTVNATATTETSKQIKDFALKTGISGQEDILVQDNGVTKRIKSSELIDTVDLTGYATETYVQNKIAEASLSGGEVDLSGYATKTDLNIKADKTELHNHSNKTVLDGITSTKVTEWNNKSTFDGNYNSLTNKPTIPTVDVNKNYVDTQLATKANKSEIPSLEGYATESYVQNKIAEASLSGGEVDLSGLATKDELNAKANAVHTHKISDIIKGTDDNFNINGETPNISTSSYGFNSDGSLDSNDEFTHIETYIDINSNLSGIISSNTDGYWLFIYYDNNKNIIGYYNPFEAGIRNELSSFTVSDIASKNADSVYFRASINKNTTITLTVFNKPTSIDYYYDVTNFGAVGDGETDDTIAIQNLINRIGIAGGGTIFFPNGIYKFTDTLNITYSNLTLKGETNSILQYHGMGRDMNFIDIYGTWEDKKYLENVILDGLTLDCTYQQFKGGADENNLTLTSPVPLQGVQNGIYIKYCYNSKIINCKFTDIYGNGMYLNRCSFCTVDNCFLEDCSASRMGDTGTDYTGDGIGASMSFGIMVSNNKVINRRTFKVHNEPGEMSLWCDAYGKQCARSGLEFEYPVNMDLWNNPEMWGAYTDLRNDTEGYALVFKNNYVYGYNKGIHIEHSVNVLIDGNTIVHCNIGIIDATGGATQIINNEFDSDGVEASPQGGYDWYYAGIAFPHFLGTTFNNPIVNGNRFYGDSDGICFGRSYITITNNDFRTTGSYIRQRGDNMTNITITGNKFICKEESTGNDTNSKIKMDLSTLNNSKITENTFVSENFYMVMNVSPCNTLFANNIMMNAKFNLFYDTYNNVFIGNVCKENIMTEDSSWAFNVFSNGNYSFIKNNIFESKNSALSAGGNHITLDSNYYIIGRVPTSSGIHEVFNGTRFINNKIRINSSAKIDRLLLTWTNKSITSESFFIVEGNEIENLNKLHRNFQWVTIITEDQKVHKRIIIKNNIPNMLQDYNNMPITGHYYPLYAKEDKNLALGTYYKCTSAGWYSELNWTSGDSYNVNDVVKTSNNKLYKCIQYGTGDNGDRVASTIEPIFDSLDDTTLDDGYVWYYLGECAGFQIYNNNNEIIE